MFKQLDMKIIGTIAFIAILLVAGTIIYTQWSYKQFASEIDVPPQSTTSTETDTPTKQAKTTQPVNVTFDTKSAPVAESSQTQVTEDKAASASKAEKPAFDASSLLPAMGLPEEVTSLLDGEPDEADYEKAEAYLQEKYGDSEEVKSIMDRLKGMSGGRVDIEDLTALFEDWIQVLPEDQQENKQNLMKILTLLREKGGQDAEIYVVTDSNMDEIDPALLEKAQAEGTIITNVETNVETQVVDTNVETTIVDE